MAASQRVAGSYIEWAPIIGGSVLACAISAILLQFGGALGFSASEVAYYRGENIIWRVIIVGLWLFWVQLMSAMLGGYFAGRLREPITGATAHESEMRDGVHGLMVWATATLLMVMAVAVGSFLTTFAIAQGVEATREVTLSDQALRRSGIILGFSITAGSIVSAIAAWWMGTLGGDHRDGETDLSRLISFRRKKK